MAVNQEDTLNLISKMISRQKEIVNEMKSLYNYARTANSEDEEEMISKQIGALDRSLGATGQEIIDTLGKISVFKPLNNQKKIAPIQPAPVQNKKATAKGMKNQPLQYSPLTPATIKALEVPDKKAKIHPGILERLTISRLKKREKKKKNKKEKEPSSYIKFASKFFYNHAIDLIDKGRFKNLEKDLVRANMELVPAAYVSVIFFTTLISVGVGFLVMLFFLFFNISTLPPFITTVQSANLLPRFLLVIWILILFPAMTFLFIYFYPSLEKKAVSGKINKELPFAVIHMSAISGSMIEPSKIFTIISSTKEYPFLEKEFTKLQNEINIYGYDLVTALRSQAMDCPSQKLAELFNGLSTTITSGGDLPEFFNKRAETLLFEHKLEIEKESKSDETFMDIYISVVVAAPMILMLLLMMMRISGIGISLSTGTITLIMVVGVIAINIFFLTFLHMKRPEG